MAAQRFRAAGNQGRDAAGIFLLYFVFSMPAIAGFRWNWAVAILIAKLSIRDSFPLNCANRAMSDYFAARRSAFLLLLLLFIFIYSTSNEPIHLSKLTPMCKMLYWEPLRRRGFLNNARLTFTSSPPPASLSVAASSSSSPGVIVAWLRAMCNTLSITINRKKMRVTSNCCCGKSARVSFGRWYQIETLFSPLFGHESGAVLHMTSYLAILSFVVYVHDSIISRLSILRL